MLRVNLGFWELDLGHKKIQTNYTEKMCRELVRIKLLELGYEVD